MDEKLTAEEIWEMLNKGKKAKKNTTDDLATAPKIELNEALPWNGGSPFTYTTSPTEEVVAEEFMPASCQFFVPSQEAVATGSELPDTWHFNRAQNYHGCTNPQFNKMGKFACEMVEIQSQCVVYQATEPVTVQKVVLTKKDLKSYSTDRQQLTLWKGKYGLATPLYEITSVFAREDGLIDPETAEDSLHVVDTADHGTETLHVVMALWDQEVEEFGEARVKDVKQDTDKVKPPSYLNALLVA